MKLIRKSICLEELISRVPTLLPYINEDGLITESEEGTHSWGKIVPNIKVPEDINIAIPDLQDIVGGKVYSLKSLLAPYYHILSSSDWSKNKDYSDYVSFIDKVISIHRIDKSLFPKSCDIPNIIPAVELDKFVEELEAMHNEITLLSKDERDNLSLTEKKRLHNTIERFKRKGGKKFIDYLNSLPALEECRAIANSFVDKTTMPQLELDVFIGCSENDLGYSELLLPQWTKGTKYYNGDMVLYEGDTYICTCEEDTYTVGIFNPSTGIVSFDYENFTKIKDIVSPINSDSYIGNFHSKEDIEYNALTRSQLINVRMFRTWADVDDIPQEPSRSNEDWLSYYKVGITDYNATSDKFGNIEHFGFDPQDGNDLIVYGSGVSNISFNEDHTEITIEYFINAHLIADFLEVEADINDKHKYKFTNFRLDKDYYDENGNLIKGKTEYAKRNNGSIFKETFMVEKNSDLYRLIRNEIPNLTFEEVINDRGLKTTFKFEFYRTIGTDGLTTRSHTKSNATDYLYGNMVKRDANIGITHQPKLKEFTQVTRGKTAYAESHIAMADIFSFEDLSNYSNGGFFKIENN